MWFISEFIQYINSPPCGYLSHLENSPGGHSSSILPLGLCVWVDIYWCSSYNRLSCLRVALVPTFIFSPGCMPYRAWGHRGPPDQITSQRGTETISRVVFYYDVIKREHFPRYWPLVWGIHRSPVNSTHKTSDTKLWCFLWSLPE